jgi:hypothetical protein
MPTEARSFRISATTRSAVKNSATWCITSAAETSFVNCCSKARMSTSTPLRWAHCRTTRQISPATRRSTSPSRSNIRNCERSMASPSFMAQDKTAHLKTEFGFDTVQVAKNRYASQQYHDFIGFQVSEASAGASLSRGVRNELKDVLTHEDLAVGSYRFAVSRMIPEMTQVALQTHKKDLMRETPDFAKRKFLYRLSRSDYERQWGKDYVKPGVGTRILSTLLRYMPRVGPFKGLAFNNPTPQTEDLYFKSINTTVDQYRAVSRRSAERHLCFQTPISIAASRPKRRNIRSRTMHLCKVADSIVGAEVRSDIAGAARQHPAVLFRPLSCRSRRRRDRGSLASVCWCRWTSLLHLKWSASSGFTALIDALNTAYDVSETRRYWKTRGLAILLTFSVGCLLVTALGLLLVGPGLSAWLAKTFGMKMLWPFVRWAVAIGCTILALELLYFVAPNVKQRFVSTLPGAVIAVGGWIGLSYLLGLYFQDFSAYSKSYGSLGIALAFSIWLYWSGFVILVGAQFNAELQQKTRGRLGAEAKRHVERNLAA